MQLGTRWRLGAEPPRLPDAVVVAVREVEFARLDSTPGSDEWRWTLTWLENKPVVELDDGTVIRYDPAGDTARVITYLEDDAASDDAEDE